MRGHHGSGRDKPARYRGWCPGKPDCKPASASGEEREEAEGVMPGLTSSVRRPLARSSAPAAPSTLLGTASSRTGRGAAPSPPGLPCLPGPLGPSSRPPGALLQRLGRPGATLGQALEQSLSLSALQNPRLPRHRPRDPPPAPPAKARLQEDIFSPTLPPRPVQGGRPSPSPGGHPAGAPSSHTCLQGREAASLSRVCVPPPSQRALTGRLCVE